jgi:ABC-type Mn2+/Zn2+ transport system ATPase subunit
MAEAPIRETDRHVRLPAPDAKVVVEARDVAAGYGDVEALHNVSVEVRAGSLIAVVGPNGAGKSTLLKVIAGLLRPWRGTISVFGDAPGEQGPRVAYVPQAELVDWAFPVTVSEVVMMGRFARLGPLRLPRGADRAAVDAALDQLGMHQLRERQIGALSGGQRRRVFLVDEPVTGIDATTQEEIMDVLAAESARGRTVIATTHDLACAAECFGRVVAINRTIVADGPAAIALDADILARAYGGHLLTLSGGRAMLDDAHHHDEAPGEHHFHERGS